MRRKAKSLICFRLSCVVFLCSVWKNVGMTQLVRMLAVILVSDVSVCVCDHENGSEPLNLVWMWNAGQVIMKQNYKGLLRKCQASIFSMLDLHQLCPLTTFVIMWVKDLRLFFLIKSFV